MEDADIQFWTFSKYETAINEFFSLYEVESILSCPDRKPNNLIYKSERECRFCGHKSGDITSNGKLVSFKNEAHIIPQMLGNKHLISDFECDICNHFLGQYDCELAAFTGASRTLSANKNKKKTIPTFISANKKAQIENSRFYTEPHAIKIHATDTENSPFDIDKNTGKVEVRYTKKYKPLSVYKSLLKMALCAVSSENKHDYKMAYEYLLSDKYDQKLTGACSLQIFYFPFNYKRDLPFIILYKKKVNDDSIPQNVFSLYFNSFIYQIIPALNKKDWKLYSGHPNNLKFPPPLFFHPPEIDSTQVTERFLDLSSTEPNTEEEIMTMNFNKDILNECSWIDPVTGESHNSEFIPSEVASMIFVPEGFSIPINNVKPND